MVYITYIENPFEPYDSKKTTIEKPGKSLKEYLPEGEVVVALDGEIVDDFSVVLKGDHQIIVAHEVKGGNGKDVLRIVAMIAVIAAAPYATSLLYGAFGSMIPAGATAFNIINGAVVAAGGMLVNSVLPPQIPSFENDSGVEGSNIYGFSGARTLPRPGAPIPILYGQFKLPGNVIAQYIEDEGDDEYIYMLLALCEGEIEPISLQDIYINNNPADTFDNVEYAYRTGSLDQINTADKMAGEAWHDGKIIGWFNKISTANVFSSEVKADTPVEKTTLGNAVEEIVVSIVLPSGLFKVNNNGGLDERTVQFKIEYSSDGVNWVTYNRVTPSYSVKEYEWVSWNPYAEYQYIWSVDQPDPTYNKTGKSRVRIIGEQTYDYFEITAAKSSTIRRQYTIELPSAGAYHVRVTKLTPDATANDEKNDLYWSGMTENIRDKLYYPGIALLGLKIKATGEMSGSAPDISVIARRKDIAVYDDTGALVGTKRSDNNAWAAWDVLTNKRYGMKIPYDGVRYSEFSDFATWCDQSTPDGQGGTEPRARFNGVIDFQTNIWEALQKIMMMGRGAPIIKGTKYGVIVDKPQDPVQLFTMGNIVENSFSVDYIGKNDLALEIDAEYMDESIGYNKSSITVSLQPGKKNKVALLGATKQSEVFRYCRYLLQTTDKTRRIVKWEAGIDSIACEPGQVVRFAHDTPAWGYSGRLVSSTVDSVTLDQEITIEDGLSYSIIIRFKDDTSEKVEIINPGAGTYDTFTLATSLTQAPEKFDIYTFGETGKEYLELRVVNITRKSDQTRKITATDYNPSILDEWSTPQPIARPSHITGFAQLTDISIGEHLEKRKDGTIIPFIDFSWRVANNRQATVDLYISSDGINWNPLFKDITTKDYRLNASDLEEGKTYTFALVTGDISGKQSIGESAKIAHTYLGKSAPPDDVSGLTYTIKSNGVLISWNENSDLDLYGYNIYIDDQLVVEKLQATNYLFADLPLGIHYIDAEAIDTSGNVSENKARTSIDISPAAISGISAQTIDNNVLLRWEATAGTVAIDHYRVEKDGVLIGSAKTTFTTIFETESGEYLYSVTPVDVFGNDGTAKSISAKVSKPPDYVLKIKWDSNFSGTKTSIHLDAEAGKMVLPVNVTETFEEHFVNNGWTTPQDQIDAGYPLYIEPFQNAASYEEIFDYGTVLASAKITVTVTKNVIMGSVAEVCTISVSGDGITWTDYAGTYSVYATNFQFVKVKLDYTGATYGGIEVDGINVVLDSKKISDSGTVYCDAADAGGTFVAFNEPFIDVESITLTPQSTTPVTVVYDFTDVPNPEGFYAYAFDASGNRVSVPAGWSAYGY